MFEAKMIVGVYESNFYRKLKGCSTKNGKKIVKRQKRDRSNDMSCFKKCKNQCNIFE